MSRVSGRPSLAAVGYGVFAAALVVLPAPPIASAQQTAPVGAAGNEKPQTQSIEIAPEHAARFSVRGGDLTVSTDLKLPNDDPTEIKLLGRDGLTRVEVGRRFDLLHTQLDEDGNRSEQLTVSATGGRVDLSRFVRGGEASSNVTLRQDSSGVWRRGRSLEARPDRVSLRVRSNQRFGGPQWPAQVDVRASSFDELLRKYPGACAKHLVPLFRDFNQDMTIFRVDAHLAWQLFPDAFGADAAMTSKVLAIVERLDAGNFRERELATTELDVLGGGAVVVLNDVDRAPLSPEQRARIDAVLAGFNRLEPDEVARLLDDNEFLIRCFVYGETEPIRAAAVRVSARRVGDEKTKGLSPASKLSDRSAQADELRGRIPVSAQPQE